MSPTPEPQPGRYLDSSGTPYEATHHKKLGWHIQKMSGERGRPPAPYQKPDFAASVCAGIFTKSPETP